MTKNQVIKIVADHIEITNLQIVKNENDNYTVYAVCSDGLVEINPKDQSNGDGVKVDVSDFFDFYFFYGDETLITRCLDKLCKTDFMDKFYSDSNLRKEIFDKVSEMIITLLDNFNEYGMIMESSEHFDYMVTSHCITVMEK